jgi:hypothetical protein
MDPAWVDDIVASSVGKPDFPDVGDDITAVCDALLEKLDASRL